MTAPTTELWRVLDDHPAAPAHLVAWRNPSGTVVTACGWQPFGGKLIDRKALFSRKFACTCCLRRAEPPVVIGAVVRDNWGGRA